MKYPNKMVNADAPQVSFASPTDGHLSTVFIELFSFYRDKCSHFFSYSIVHLLSHVYLYQIAFMSIEITDKIHFKIVPTVFSSFFCQNSPKCPEVTMKGNCGKGGLAILPVINPFIKSWCRIPSNLTNHSVL